MRTEAQIIRDILVLQASTPHVRSSRFDAHVKRKAELEKELQGAKDRAASMRVWAAQGWPMFWAPWTY